MSKTIYSKEYQRVISKLKKARKSVNLTQGQVAKKLKKPQSFISKCESGQRRLDITELGKIAKIYKKNLDFFIK